MADREFKYSGYCTVFWFEEKGQFYVWMWDELTNRTLMRIKVSDKEAALKLMDDYVRNSPANAICQKIN